MSFTWYHKNIELNMILIIYIGHHISARYRTGGFKKWNGLLALSSFLSAYF